MLLLFASIHSKLFTFIKRLFTYVYSVNCYDWKRDEASGYGALWTMSLILPLVFFFFNSFYSVPFFFFPSLLVSILYFFLLLRLCFFSDLLFKGGEPRGLVYLEAKLVLVRWLASAFLSLFLFSLRLLSDLPSLSPSVCIVHSLCYVCPLCVCLLFLFLFVLCLSPGLFLFYFPLFLFFIRASVMACIVGARRMLP
ncbi:hypothetical protein NC653_023334 [Populus alba x Populus x berolinensis]|uniref:Uncharacterized protein n=1 Tax=Populus alba x Populus x berolinensis TaxID=444605 RepID=A0AAD6MGY3_9ROSI|nr:hypothetical protein NC653_023334 [Populus alba x Populus x berolinensis]